MREAVKWYAAMNSQHFELYLKTLPIESFANWLDRMKDFGYGIVSENLK